MREIGISPRFSRDKFVPLQTKQRYSTRDISSEVFLTLFFRGFVPFLSLADFVSRDKNLQVADLQRLKLYFGGLVTATTSNAQKAPYVKIVIDRHGELGQGFSLIIPAKKAKKTLLLAFAHILIELKKSLPYRTNENGILVCEVYFKIKVFNTLCYGEYDGVRVLKAVTISSDGNYTFVNVEEDECVPEDFTKSNPPMSIILQYDLYSIETNMLVSKEEFDAHWEKCKDLCES